MRLVRRCGSIVALSLLFASQSSAQWVLPSTPRTLLRHTIDGTSTIVLRWDPVTRLALELDGVPISDLETKITDDGVLFRGGIVGDEATIEGLVAAGADEGSLVIQVDAFGWDAFQAELDDDGMVIAAQVCRCSAVGPTGTTCAKNQDCQNLKSCGTGKYCQFRYSFTEPIPLD